MGQKHDPSYSAASREYAQLLCTRTTVNCSALNSACVKVFYSHDTFPLSPFHLPHNQRQGMLFLDVGNQIILEALKQRMVNGHRDPCEIMCSDFDGKWSLRYHELKKYRRLDGIHLTILQTCLRRSLTIPTYHRCILQTDV